MIISVADAKAQIAFPGAWSDEKIRTKLLAVEQTIRAYTNNNFQDRDRRRTCEIVGGLFLCDALCPFSAGDTVQISEGRLNKGLFVVSEAGDGFFRVEEPVTDEAAVLATKIDYPADVKDCCINLLEWEIDKRAKVGIKSETLSRHSVTYEDSNDLFLGYPKGILGIVSLYRKMRC